MKFIRRALAGALITATVVVGIATPAVAFPQLVAASVADETPIFVFDGIPTPVLIGIVTGAIIPAIVALIARVIVKVTNSTMSPLAKGVLLSGLTVLSGVAASVGESLTKGDPINLGILLATTASAFVVAVTTYFGLTSRLSSNGRSISDVLKGKHVLENDASAIAASFVSRSNGRTSKP